MSSSNTNRNRIVGLSWKKLRRSLEQYEPIEVDDNIDDTCSEPETPVTRSRSKLQGTHRCDESISDTETNGNNSTTTGDRFRQRARSFRITMGTLKQKLKVSTRRRKRLTLDSGTSPFITRAIMSTPDSPSKASSKRHGSANRGLVSSTQTSSTKERVYPRTTCRTSPRSVPTSEVKMYSPFFIDTPSKTPKRIKMGIQPPRRCPFESPGQLERDIAVMTEGVQTLAQISDNWGNNNENQSPRYQMKTRSHSHSETPKQKTRNNNQSRRSLGSQETEGTKRTRRSLGFTRVPIYV